MATAKKRVHLTIDKKVEIIKYAADHPGTGVRALGEHFKVGKTQVSDILKNKDDIQKAFESNLAAHQKPRNSKFSSVNEALYEWFRMVCAKNIYPSGPQLITKGKEIATRLGIDGFEGSSGWLTKWKGRYNIKKTEYAESLAMYLAKQLAHGKNDSLNYSKVTKQKIFST